MTERDEAARAVGRYLLYGEIASGGMATVHFGRLNGPAGFARTVAVKRLHPHLAREADLVASFLDEARLAARVRHPNVASILDVVAASGEIFLVMEYFEGETLARLVRSVHERGGHVPPRIASAVLSGVLHGLHAAHEAVDERGTPLGIVHRDVSPQNILVGTDGVARVLDFGVAKAVARLQTTRAGELKGKLAYMPPERFLDALPTRQTDVYATAVVMWEALTGKRLFRSAGDSDDAIIAAITSGVVQRPSEMAPDVLPACDDVVMTGLARDLGVRYATALEMALALEQRVGVASALEVGAWVEDVAAGALAERRDRVRAIERAPEQGQSVDEILRAVQGETPARAAVASPAPAPKWSRVLPITLAAALVLVAVLVVVRRERPAEHVAPPVTTAPETDTSEAPPLPDEVPPVTPEPTSVVAPPRRSHPRPVTGSTPRKPSPAPATSAPPTSGCVATFDEKGKHWRCP